jgi:hypothetical protein
VPPERPARRTHPDSGNGGSGSVVAAAPVGITTYDADGDRRCRRCPRGAATDVDVMMMMAGERGGEATARRRRGDGEATARRVQGNDKATRMRRQSAMAPQVAGATRNQQEDNK